MGGRKGYSLNRIAKNSKDIRGDKQDLLEAIQHNDVKQAVRSSAQILAKSDDALEALAHSFLFVGSLGKKVSSKLGKEKPRKRKLELSKKWAEYRKETGKSFSASENRDIVDTAARILGGEK